jgi:hypothetical protein
MRFLCLLIHGTRVRMASAVRRLVSAGPYRERLPRLSSGRPAKNDFEKFKPVFLYWQFFYKCFVLRVLLK